MLYRIYLLQENDSLASLASPIFPTLVHQEGLGQNGEASLMLVGPKTER